MTLHDALTNKDVELGSLVLEKMYRMTLDKDETIWCRRTALGVQLLYVVEDSHYEAG